MRRSCSSWGCLAWRKAKLKWDLKTGVCNKVEVGLFSQVTRNRTSANHLKLCQGKFRLVIREKKYSLKEQSSTGTDCPEKWLSHYALEVFKRCVHVALWDIKFSGRLDSVALMAGCDDLRGLFQPNPFCDTIIL